MSAEARVREHAERSGPDSAWEAVGDPPVLTPTLVAPHDAVEAMVARALADLGRLECRLRELEQVIVQDPAEEAAPLDVEAAHELLRVSLDRHLGKKRKELADALALAQMEAAAVVTTAHQEATARISAANAEVVDALLRGVGPAAVGSGPSLRVVEVSETVPVDIVPLSNEAAPSCIGAADAAAVAGEPISDRHTGETVSVPTRADVATLAVPSVSSDVEHLAVALAAYVAELQTPPRIPTDRPPAPTSAAPIRRWNVGQFLYLDVVLPLVAVLIVVIVLLAWVG